MSLMFRKALKIDGLWNDPVIRDLYNKRGTALQVQSNALKYVYHDVK